LVEVDDEARHGRGPVLLEAGEGRDEEFGAVVFAEEVDETIAAHQREDEALAVMTSVRE